MAPPPRPPGLPPGQELAAAGLRWHFDCQGSGPLVLLLHGTGSARHSWAGLAPLLVARGFQVVAPDLPGHGATSPLPTTRCTLAGMAEALQTWLTQAGLSPVMVIGHSAGAALSAQWALDGPRPALRQLVWLAGALRPLGGWAGRVGPPLARWMASSHWVPRLAAWHARDPRAVRRLIEGTGSRLGPAGVQAYAEVWRQPAHVAGTLAMMAGWDLAPLQARLPRLQTPVLWLHGTADRTVRPEEAEAVGRQLPGVRVQRLPGLGHLMHEEAPGLVSELAVQALAERQPGRVAAADATSATAGTATAPSGRSAPQPH